MRGTDILRLQLDWSISQADGTLSCMLAVCQAVYGITAAVRTLSPEAAPKNIRSLITNVTTLYPPAAQTERTLLTKFFNINNVSVK